MQAREGENIDRRHLLFHGSSSDRAKRSEQGELKFKLQLISKPKLLDIDDTSVVDKYQGESYSKDRPRSTQETN